MFSQLIYDGYSQNNTSCFSIGPGMLKVDVGGMAVEAHQYPIMFYCHAKLI